MLELNKRIGIMSSIINEKPNIGKTAMMKFVFLLQSIYKVPFGYDYDIYTYGPYSSTVMEDIDYAKQNDIISIQSVTYPTGHFGYMLNTSKNTQKVLDEERDFVSKYATQIKSIVDMFGNKTAKELELLTTIVFLYDSYCKNGWACTPKEISQNVHEIKPHFDISLIEHEYKNLDELRIFEQLVC